MEDIAKNIDHTLLKQDATKEELINLCHEAIKYGFKGVCVYPKDLKVVIPELKDSKVLPIAVVDFPKGDSSPKDKAHDAKKAVDLGAKEIDMVIDVLALKDKNFKLVYDGIKAVVDAAKCPVKVIIETCYLNYNEKVIACALSDMAGAKFVKTSTGFGKGGATVEDVLLMRKIVSDHVQVKASGGIRTYEKAIEMIDAGADRIGTSQSVNIITS